MTVRETSIHHHYEPAYRAMGIPDAMLPEVKRLLNMEVESSPKNNPDTPDFRSDDADKMWERLVGKGIAEYLPDRGVYRVL